MQKKIEDLLSNAKRQIESISSLDQLKQFKVDYLGKKGSVTALFKEIPKASPEERKELGKLLNVLRKDIEAIISSKNDSLSNVAASLDRANYDFSMDVWNDATGRLHPITQVMDEIKAIFSSLGFEIAEGPEVETQWFNFEALNIPDHHPAREMQDTFYINDERVLRTHTSSVQIRHMTENKPPLRIISPGRVYRKDSDVSHTPMFHQVEGLCVEEGIHFGHLKGVLKYFIRRMFGNNVELRFRPSFFPFTEPSTEVDMSCILCSGEGCRFCKYTGWLEVLGAGMVHPNVFKSVGFPEGLNGFAFGLGIERFTALKFGISDIRQFFDNSEHFLNQFPHFKF